jgi:four helix bundle protein
MSKTFENLRAFQRALDLMIDVYTATECFPASELYGMTSQLRRASTSVVSHIAEGQGRRTFGEWRQMLSQARGSLYEAQAQIIASRHLRFLGVSEAAHLLSRARAVGRELAGLLTWVRRREVETKRHTRQKAAPDPTDAGPGEET